MAEKLGRTVITHCMNCGEMVLSRGGGGPVSQPGASRPSHSQTSCAQMLVLRNHNRGAMAQAGLYIVPSPREKRTQKKASCNFSSLRQPRYSSLSTNISYFPARTAGWEVTGPCPHPSQIPKPQNAPCWSLGWKCKRSVIISPWAVTVRAAV